MTRHAYDEAEAMRVRATPAPATDGLSLFDAPAEPPTAPAWTTTWHSLTDDERRAQRVRWQEQLLPIVRELSGRAQGVTASEVLAAAIEGQLLWGERSFLSKYPRAYAWIGPWLAQLARAGTIKPLTAVVEGHGTLHLRRESSRDLSHDNAGLIYTRAA